MTLYSDLFREGGLDFALTYPTLRRITDSTDITFGTVGASVTLGSSFTEDVPADDAALLILSFMQGHVDGTAHYSLLQVGMRVNGVDHYQEDTKGRAAGSTNAWLNAFQSTTVTEAKAALGLQIPSMDIELAGVPTGLKTLQMRLKNSANAATTMTLVGTTKTTHIALGYAESL